MILNSTTDSLEAVLSGTVLSNQLQFISSFNIISNSGLTPSNLNGTTNNLTPVSIISSPLSNQQNQLRFCSIYNSDSTGQTLTVQFNNNGTRRIVYSVPLRPGESVQYTNNNGWQTYDENGLLKVVGMSQNPSSIRMQEYFSSTGTSQTLICTTGTDFAFYLGKADRTLRQVTVQLNVTTAIGATITYAEAAIYKGTTTIGSGVTATLCGWKESSGSTGQSNFGSIGVKQIPIQVTGITAGDDLWFVIGTVTSGTNLAIRGGMPDELGAGFIQTATGSLRPSTNNSITFTKQSTTNNGWIAWQGFQW